MRARSPTAPQSSPYSPPASSSKPAASTGQIPGYRPSPLRNLSSLASMLSVGGIWVKDESVRLNLNSFKVLGGSFAIYQFIRSKLGLTDESLTYDELVSEATKAKVGEITFATATDGNHGRGVAWGASKLNCKAVIYVHKDTSVARIRAIEAYGAEVRVVDGNYDDAVRQASVDADANGWQVISDTSWDGYTDIPSWVMQGYTTMLSEAQEQLGWHRYRQADSRIRPGRRWCARGSHHRFLQQPVWR